jgi:hypothetical protein
VWAPEPVPDTVTKRTPCPCQEVNPDRSSRSQLLDWVLGGIKISLVAVYRDAWETDECSAYGENDNYTGYIPQPPFGTKRSSATRFKSTQLKFWALNPISLKLKNIKISVCSTRSTLYLEHTLHASSICVPHGSDTRITSFNYSKWISVKENAEYLRGNAGSNLVLLEFSRIFISEVA